MSRRKSICHKRLIIREIDPGKFHPFGSAIDRELLDRLQVYRTAIHLGRRNMVGFFIQWPIFASAIAVVMMLAGSISYPTGLAVSRRPRSSSAPSVRARAAGRWRAPAETPDLARRAEHATTSGIILNNI